MIKVAKDQVWNGKIIVFAGEDTIVYKRRGVEESRSLTDFLAHNTLNIHQNGAVLDWEDYDYFTLERGDNNDGVEFFQKGSWYPSIEASPHLLYRRAKSLLTQYDLQVGTLYYKETMAIIEVKDARTAMLHYKKGAPLIRPLSGTSVCGDRENWEAVERTDPRAFGFFNPLDTYSLVVGVMYQARCLDALHPVMEVLEAIDNRNIRVKMHSPVAKVKPFTVILDATHPFVQSFDSWTRIGCNSVMALKCLSLLARYDLKKGCFYYRRNHQLLEVMDQEGDELQVIGYDTDGSAKHRSLGASAPLFTARERWQKVHKDSAIVKSFFSKKLQVSYIHSILVADNTPLHMWPSFESFEGAVFVHPTTGEEKVFGATNRIFIDPKDQKWQWRHSSNEDFSVLIHPTFIKVKK